MRLIETPQLMLRPFEDGDVDALFAIQGDPIAMQYTFCARTRAESAQHLRAYEGQRSVHGFAPWTAMIKADRRVVGWGGLNIDPFDPRWGIEVGYFFHPAYWGRGLATELVRAALADGFGRLGLARIGAFARPANVGSIRVLEKAAFRCVGFVPELERNRYAIDRDHWRRTCGLA